MKRVAVVAWVFLLLAGCGDSTSDVANTAFEEALVEPDTVVIEDGIVMEVYEPDNAVTIDRREALSANADVQRAFDRLAETGFEQDWESAIFARATAPDGREMEITWVALEDPSMSVPPGGLVHLLLDGEAFVFPFRAKASPDGSQPEFEVLSANKGDSGPSGSFGGMFSPCWSYAMSIYYACMSDCIKTMPVWPCRVFCAMHAVMVFVRCVTFTQL